MDCRGCGWDGGNSERRLKWGGEDVIEESLLKLFKRREWVDKGRNCSHMEVILKVSIPLPPLPIKLLVVHILSPSEKR